MFERGLRLNKISAKVNKGYIKKLLIETRPAVPNGINQKILCAARLKILNKIRPAAESGKKSIPCDGKY